MPVVRLVALARRALFDEPCAVLSDDRDVPRLIAVPLPPGDLPGFARVLDPWLPRPSPQREMTVRLDGDAGGNLYAVVAPVEPGREPVLPPEGGRETSMVDALTLAHRSRVPVRIDGDLLDAYRVDPCDIDGVVPIADRPPLIPTAEQQHRLARAFAALEGHDGARRRGSARAGPPVS
ncbi:hypothetical protein LQ327_14295 [Actinomycetospora endophytica]|uniref:Type III secretion system (T3SS) SseB-like protein n=1 Tax=Actinomycetospora endophytica TaxID=2291215 RepID=A0ABS8PAK2_9PSEU|nr:hypothetical protein [Actinomycetospora endophytica]MCD2194540.1 hypothetical protein [Actinomycetospora endophytica]